MKFAKILIKSTVQEVANQVLSKPLQKWCHNKLTKYQDPCKKQYQLSDQISVPKPIRYNNPQKAYKYQDIRNESQ